MTSLFGEKTFSHSFTFMDDQHSPVKQRKIDEEGFVTPATPDIPRLSIHNSIFSAQNSLLNFENTDALHLEKQKRYNSESNVESKEQNDKYENLEEENVSGISNDYSKVAEPEFEVSEKLKEVGQGDSYAFSNVESIPSGVNTGASGNQESEMNSTTDIKELIQGLSEEAKHLQGIWCTVFGGSENFEYFQPSRVDKLLKDALALEQHLLGQKEKLKQRLSLLGQTLQGQ